MVFEKQRVFTGVMMLLSCRRDDDERNYGQIKSTLIATSSGAICN